MKIKCVAVFIAIVFAACKNASNEKPSVNVASDPEKSEIVGNSSNEEILKQDSIAVTEDELSNVMKEAVDEISNQKTKAQPDPPRIVKTPYDVIVELSKKYKFVGVWDMGWPGHYKVIVNRNGRYYFDTINTDTEELVKSNEVLKRISSKKYQRNAAVDMPENLVIDEAGNLNSYVYNPDMYEWVFMGMNVRVY